MRYICIQNIVHSKFNHILSYQNHIHKVLMKGHIKTSLSVDCKSIVYDTVIRIKWNFEWCYYSICIFILDSQPIHASTDQWSDTTERKMYYWHLNGNISFFLFFFAYSYLCKVIIVLFSIVFASTSSSVISLPLFSVSCIKREL